MSRLIDFLLDRGSLGACWADLFAFALLFLIVKLALKLK